MVKTADDLRRELAKAYAIAISGRHQADMDRLCRDLARLCKTHIELFQTPAPFNRYLFLVNAVGDGYGGYGHGSYGSHGYASSGHGYGSSYNYGPGGATYGHSLSSIGVSTFPAKASIDVVVR